MANAGGNTGDAVGSVQDHLFFNHSHSIDSKDSGGSAFANSGFLGAINGGGPDRTKNSKGAGGSETRPINANVNYIIKVV